MSDDEATKFLDSLHNARVVVRDDKRVFVHPIDVINRVHSHLGVPRLAAITVNDKMSTLSNDINESAKKSAAPTEATAVWRNRFWGAVAVGSGAQMSVLSYLTFVTYGWDVMEPACYFITCATSVAFYVYFLLYRREQSLQQVDENIIPVVLEKKHRESGVNSKRWIESLDAFDSLRKADEIGTYAASREFQEWLSCSPNPVK